MWEATDALMLHRTLGRTSLSVSQIGFGASPLGDVFGAIDSAEAARAVQQAVEAGINFFDVSPYYGSTLAEERLGKALAGIRNKVIVATKCGRYGDGMFDFSAARIRRSIDESLTRLRTDYVDLLQAHDIEFGSFEQIVNETVPALREVQRSGKARYIGITGYPLGMLRRVAERERVDSILSYCHYNLLVSDLDVGLGAFARANGIGLLNASPLHMGLLSGHGTLPEWHPAPAKVRRAADEVVRLCRKRGVSPAAVALRYSIGHPYVASTLVGMATRDQVDANLKALELGIDQEFRREIERAVAPAKDVVWASGRAENTGPVSADREQEQEQLP
jgi:L-galactose dehydrogenase